MTSKQQPQTIGVVLVNLGSPEAPEPKAVARFLRDFLGDPRVVEIPRLPWWLLLNLVIAPLRSRRSAEKYAQIWWPEGSPLRVILRRQVSALQEKLDTSDSGRYRVVEAVSYGAPGIGGVLDQLEEEGIQRSVIVPLYPQYSGTTTGSIYDQLADYCRGRRTVPDLRVIRDYHACPEYIDALAQSVRKDSAENGAPQCLVMSFHGIPQRNVDLGDPYQAHCQATAQLLAVTLGLADDAWVISFQSRLGPAKWLEPDTSVVLAELAKNGCKHVQVVCPAFAADCLETLEEIAMENRDIFFDNGGETYRYVPCLNDSAAHIAMLSQLVKSQSFSD